MSFHHSSYAIPCLGLIPSLGFIFPQKSYPDPKSVEGIPINASITEKSTPPL